MIPFRINVPFSRTLHPLRYLGLSLSRRSYVNGKKYAFENEKIILETEKGRAAKDNDSLFEDIWRPNTFDANLPNSNHPLTAFKLRKSVSKRKSLLPLDTDIPILHVLQNPELRNYRFIPYSKNPYTSGEKIFEYSISETTRKLILNTILPLIKNDVVESINSIPSISSGLVVFSTPFIGSENYTKQLALFIASASEIQADFISIRLSDVFGRVPPFRALEGSFRTKETMEDSDENFDGNIFPLNLISERLNSLQKGRDAVIITETPKVNSSFSSSFSSSSSRKDKLHEFTDTTDVPFPWARRYYQGKNPLLIPRYHGASPSNISNLITSKFFKVFNAINLLKPSGNRKIIFFEDLMRLCSNQSQTLRDELVKSILLAISQVRQKYEEEGIGANFVVVTPNTEHKISEKTTSEKSQSIFQVIGNINEILSEGSIKDEENIHSTKLGPGTTLHGELDFGSPFSHALGVITIPVFPCASEVDIWEFQKKLDEDHKISVVESNLIELGIYSQFCNLLLPYDWKAIWLIGKYSPNPLFKSLSPLSFWQSPLDQLEVERLLEILFSKAKLKKKTSEETSGSLRSSDHLQNVHNEIPLPVPESESHFHVSIDDMNECANIILTTQLQKMELTNIFRVKSYFPYASPTARASQSLLNLIDKKQNLTKHRQK
ncbi:hypothetical protein HMI54_006182 [Coelomomyces lativittatus]|nr:hypothetical protein HMI54_006182 [Coelomomyces lativittatus]